jgi:hypothetical protein
MSSVELASKGLDALRFESFELFAADLEQF